MIRRIFLTVVICMVSTFVVMDKAVGDELIVVNCAELMRMTQNLREDLKTTDIMLGVALENGSMQTVKTYKLKRETINQKLQSVLQAINLKGCARTN